MEGRRMIAALAALVAVGCAGLAVNEGDSVAKKAAKIATRVPLAPATLFLSEYVVRSAEKKRMKERVQREQFAERIQSLKTISGISGYLGKEGECVPLSGGTEQCEWQLTPDLFIEKDPSCNNPPGLQVLEALTVGWPACHPMVKPGTRLACVLPANGTARDDSGCALQCYDFDGVDGYTVRKVQALSDFARIESPCPTSLQDLPEWQRRRVSSSYLHAASQLALFEQAKAVDTIEAYESFLREDMWGGILEVEAEQRIQELREGGEQRAAAEEACQVQFDRVTQTCVGYAPSNEVNSEADADRYIKCLEHAIKKVEPGSCRESIAGMVETVAALRSSTECWGDLRNIRREARLRCETSETRDFEAWLACHEFAGTQIGADPRCTELLVRELREAESR